MSIWQDKSLREIYDVFSCSDGELTHLGMKGTPKHTTLSYANRPFYQTLSICNIYAPGKHKYSLKNRLLYLESLQYQYVCNVSLGRRQYNKRCLDHDGYLPSYALISNGIKSDVQIPLATGSIFAIDRAYNDYKIFAY